MAMTTDDRTPALHEQTAQPDKRKEPEQRGRHGGRGNACEVVRACVCGFVAISAPQLFTALPASQANNPVRPLEAFSVPLALWRPIAHQRPPLGRDVTAMYVATARAEAGAGVVRHVCMYVCRVVSCVRVRLRSANDSRQHKDPGDWRQDYRTRGCGRIFFALSVLPY